MNTMSCLVPLLLISPLFFYQSSTIETSQKREVKTVTIYNSQSQNYGLSHRLKLAVFQIKRRVLFPTGVGGAAKGVAGAGKRAAHMSSPANRNVQFA
ncbi:hypothetical protein LguiB_031786 [Lonicera macranthoides]